MTLGCRNARRPARQVCRSDWRMDCKDFDKARGYHGLARQTALPRSVPKTAPAGSYLTSLMTRMPM